MEYFKKYQYTFFLTTLLLRLAQPYSGGAPTVACNDMIPRHGPSPQSSPPPYILSTDTNNTSEGQRIGVRLRSSGPSQFKGFLIQARSVDGGRVVGSFISEDHGLMSCADGNNNAVTHSSPAGWKDVQVVWEAPSSALGPIQFRASVVQDYNTFWTGITSQELTIRKRSSGDPTPPVPSANLPDPTSTVDDQSARIKSYIDGIYEGCGETKTCIGNKPDCFQQNNKNCDYMVTYTYAGGGMYEFELKGRGGPRRYVAAGLSYDRFMGDDSVMVCGSTSDSVDIFMTWNTNDKNNENVRRPGEGLMPLVSGDTDGDLYCRFQRQQTTTPKPKMTFNLANDKFHVMVAQGFMSDDKRLSHHGGDKTVSGRPLALGLTAKKLDQRDPELSRIFRVSHACLMIGAWICAASCGILMARYFKQTWLAYRCCNIDQWFHSHRFFMILTWSSTVVAVSLIVYELREFRVSYHSIIGIVSVGLCFIQPFMAALRPHPQAKGRAAFNWLHWLVGNSAQILGVAAIFFGFELFLGSRSVWTKDLAWAILVVFIAFHCFCHLLLSIAQCCSDRQPRGVDVFPLKDFVGSRSLLQPDKARVDAPYGCFRKFILALYLPLNWTITALLMILVIFTREQIEEQLTKWRIPPFWEDL